MRCARPFSGVSATVPPPHQAAAAAAALLTTLTGRKAAMVSLRLLLVQESQRGYSPFSNTYCSPLQLGCSYPTHLQRESHTCYPGRMSQRPPSEQAQRLDL